MRMTVLKTRLTASLPCCTPSRSPREILSNSLGLSLYVNYQKAWELYEKITISLRSRTALALPVWSSLPDDRTRRSLLKLVLFLCRRIQSRRSWLAWQMPVSRLRILSTFLPRTLWRVAIPSFQAMMVYPSTVPRSSSMASYF